MMQRAMLGSRQLSTSLAFIVTFLDLFCPAAHLHAYGVCARMNVIPSYQGFFLQAPCARAVNIQCIREHRKHKRLLHYHILVLSF